MIKQIFDNIGSLLLIAVFVLLVILETKFELRKRVHSRFKRIFINVVVAIPSFTLLRFLFLPIIIWLAIKNESLNFGLNYLYSLPPMAETMIAFLLLDYTNYLWHILNHKLPILWRFHLVHHTDLDLDITTAFRFHFGELIGSVFFRGTAVFLIGVSPEIVLVYEIIFEAATQFHHSNTRLPFRFEQLLNKLFVTPRMHGIHHSVIQTERDSNYSVIFSFWDRIHKTFTFNKPQQLLVIGVPLYNDQKELTIGFLLKMPFTKIRKGKKPLLTDKPPQEGK